MPELPEVETIKRGLEEMIPPSSVITSVWRSKELLRFPYPRGMKSKLIKSQVVSLSRRAKYLFWHLDKMTLISHLGMTGTWRKESISHIKKHDHFSIQVNHKFWLVYNDPRRFGYVDLVPSDELNQSKWIVHLGPEPNCEKNFTPAYLIEKLKHKTAPIKNIIMDQKIVVGVGNIYASEALFLAGIRPNKACNKITQAKYRLLHKSIMSTINAAIEAGGTTISDFRQVGGGKGYFQQKLNVYGRAGQPCVNCSSQIKNITLQARSSFFCPKCQK